MFRLEKVFQNDDSGYILFTNFIKSVSLLIFIYIFVILQDNSIYELVEFSIYKNSNYFIYSIILSIFFFIISFFLKNRKEYKRNFISFLREDMLNIFLSTIFTLSTIFIFNIDFILESTFLYLLLLSLIVLLIVKLYFNYIYQKLIDKNIIQKNIMLVGSYNEIKKILSEKFDKIIIFKCCMITDLNNLNIKLIKSEIKFPIFKEHDDIRSILEYHSLGQIWILNGDKNKSDVLSKIFKFSVDTLNIKLEKTVNIKGKKLLADKYDFEYFEMSRFYGVNLFLKILIDKILSLIFLLIASPILIFSAIAIYLEDGYPILFTQNRTGWDGRRFKIYKLRSLKKVSFDKTLQVTKDDKRLLRIGKIIRRYSIDELPQFINVLNGDMSIVGPRPHMVEHDIHYSSLFGNFLKRHKCNPGLTGWAQVNGLRGATPAPEIMKRRMEYDLWYLNNWTVWLDLYIIFKTFYALLKYKGD
ncbi:exopolysaccharide biosynthesis polyprenyl glycosylphosphotransferase [Candidatus Pelagibacter sp.]|nr:exopolysaccharide biosynthesis polyprenyl glycosylphosphotransferase [Candidatus Pelagibacter sp.]